jgi:hypothetical protein
MSRALSVDLRVRVLAAVAGGLTHLRRASGSVWVRPASAAGASLNANRALRSRRRWAAIGVQGGSRPMARRYWPCWARRLTSRLTSCVVIYPNKAWFSATARSAAFSNATRSRAKKDSPRLGAGPARRSDPARAMVRGPARSRPRAAGLH